MGAGRALIISSGVSLGAYFGLGFPGWAAAGIAVLGFLGFGGWPWTKLVFKTLPRDLKALVKLIKAIRCLSKNKESKVADVFMTHVSRHPDKVAILFEDQVWTFRQLDDYSNQVANFFQNEGLKAGDTVALFMANCPEYIGISLGLNKLGITASYINFNLRGNALLHCLNISNAVAIIHDSGLTEAVDEINSQLDERLRQSAFAIGNGAITSINSRSFDIEIKNMPTTKPPLSLISANDKYCNIYTSGTTGLPKAVPIRNIKFMSMALGLTFVGGFTNDDVVYCALPLYHSNGGVLATGQLLLNGSTLVVRRKFSASQFWNDCIKYRCTAIIYIGEFCRYLLAQPPRATDKQHMVRLASGNGLRKHIWKQFQERFNIQHIREFYGSTEGNSNLLNVEGIPGACGFKSLLIPMAIPVYVVKVDPETEEIVRNENGFCIEAPYNEPGELIGQIKDNFLRRFDGYHNKEATNKKILTDVFKKGDKYFRTGDMLYMDERGTLYFADRTGDTFRWKGENVSTSEVETLMAQVLTKEIHVAVYGVEIPKTEGRAGMAVIESDPETCKISKLAGNLYDVLPAYSVPLFLRFVDQIEMTGTHKYKKTTYRKEGFNVETIKDPIYVLQNKVYVPLTSEIYQSILNGTWRV